MKKGAIPLIISIGSTIVISLISYAFVNLSNDVSNTEKVQGELVKTVSSLEADNKTMKEWLTRVEGKLDRVIAE